MSWFKDLFGKCDDACKECCCEGDEKEMNPTDEPVETEPEIEVGEETPTME